MNNLSEHVKTKGKIFFNGSLITYPELLKMLARENDFKTVKLFKKFKKAGFLLS